MFLDHFIRNKKNTNCMFCIITLFWKCLLSFLTTCGPVTIRQLSIHEYWSRFLVTRCPSWCWPAVDEGRNAGIWKTSSGSWISAAVLVTNYIISDNFKREGNFKIICYRSFLIIHLSLVLLFLYLSLNIVLTYFLLSDKSRRKQTKSRFNKCRKMFR